YQRTDLIHLNDSDSAAIAQAQLDTYKDAAQRVDSLTFRPSLFPATLEAALTLDLLWLIEVRRRATGFQVIAQLQTQAIEHNVSAHEWAVAVRTYSASAVFNAALWDRDEWDVGLWGY